MRPHHAAWLAANPHRTEHWLAERTKDGFDIHHLDGNHSNNDPLNLVLIDGGDHLMIHNGKKRLHRIVPRAKVDRPPSRIMVLRNELREAEKRLAVAHEEARKLSDLLIQKPEPAPEPAAQPNNPTEKGVRKKGAYELYTMERVMKEIEMSKWAAKNRADRKAHEAAVRAVKRMSKQFGEPLFDEKRCPYYEVDALPAI